MLAGSLSETIGKKLPTGGKRENISQKLNEELNDDGSETVVHLG